MSVDYMYIKIKKSSKDISATYPTSQLLNNKLADIADSRQNSKMSIYTHSIWCILIQSLEHLKKDEETSNHVYKILTLLYIKPGEYNSTLQKENNTPFEPLPRLPHLD